MKWPLLVLIVLTSSACSAAPQVIHQPTAHFSTTPKKIYVVSHGWHTGFVVPTKDIQSLVPALQTRFTQAAYLELGWGDQGFYQAEDITLGLTLKAILWPTDSVVHVVAVSDSPERFFNDSQVESLCLAAEDYEKLLSFIANSFAIANDNQVIALQKGIYGDSQFYRAVGDYYLMNTCNTWTAKGLKSAGYDIAANLKLTASSVMRFISEQNTETPSAEACQ